MQLCQRARVPCSLENPATSYLWRTPPALRIARLSKYSQATTEFCMFGKPWRKSTIVAGVYLDLQRFQEYRCLDKPRGLCKRTNLPHLVLSGRDPDKKQFMTLTAQPYPRGFCTLLARMFNDASTALRCASMQSTLI